METYNGVANALWPAGIAIPDDADLAKGISAIDPALEALADRTAILKGHSSKWQMVESASVAQPGQPIPVTLYDHWIAPATENRLFQTLYYTAEPNDIVDIAVSFTYSSTVAGLAVRLGWIASPTTTPPADWTPLLGGIAVSPTGTYAGKITLIGSFVPTTTVRMFYDVGLQQNDFAANANIYGPINWHYQVRRAIP